MLSSSQKDFPLGHKLICCSNPGFFCDSSFSTKFPNKCKGENTYAILLPYINTISILMKRNEREDRVNMSMIKNENKITRNFKILKWQITISRKKLVTGEMAEIIICLPNSKPIMMKLMWSLLKNIIKSKVMKIETT